MPKVPRPAALKSTQSYQHPEADLPTRPEVGVQSKFRKSRPAQKYRYDSSLAPELAWDGQNPAREAGEAQLGVISDQWSVISEGTRALLAMLEAAAKEHAGTLLGSALQKLITDHRSLITDHLPAAREALRKLKALSVPFLNWAGKAERLSFEVPTLPLFVHERLSTKAIIETLKGHRSDRQEDFINRLFEDPGHSITDQVLKAYEYRDDWVNRLILGDSLVVMNSLLHYEALGGQVQMIYVDPPYGVKFGSNFQPFVRKRDVAHGDDEDMTREPEMVQAYRDTWELGLHSYLTYLRDRLLLSRELLAPSGSVFVQISDENLHHVREVMDEVFGAENFCAQIVFRKTTGKGGQRLDNTYDSLLWYAKDSDRVKYRPLFERRSVQEDENLRFVELSTGDRRKLTADEISGAVPLEHGARVFRPNPITNQRPAQGEDIREFVFEGKTFKPGVGTFRTDKQGMSRLADAKRLMAVGNTLSFVRYLDDFPYKPRNDIWDDTRQSGFGESKLYVVQTAPKVIERCILMNHRPR